MKLGCWILDSPNISKTWQAKKKKVQMNDTLMTNFTCRKLSGCGI